MRLPALVLLAACSFPTKSPGVSDGRKVDGANQDGSMADSQTADSPPPPPIDAPPPASITISGTVEAFSLTGSGSTIAGIPISLVSTAGGVLGSTSSDSTGAYSFTVQTNGVPVDAFLRASGGSAFMDTYVWPPGPVGGDDIGVVVTMATATGVSQVATLCGASQDPAKSTIIVQVIHDGSVMGGATVTSTPAAGDACVDAEEPGVTGLFNVSPGSTTVSATESGQVFVAHAVDALASTLTTTQIIER